MKALFVEGLERPQLLLKKKLLLLNWPFLLLITAITLVGVAALYSVAGGSLDPWASRHVVRYCIGLALLFAVALSDIRFDVTRKPDSNDRAYDLNPNKGGGLFARGQALGLQKSGRGQQTDIFRAFRHGDRLAVMGRHRNLCRVAQVRDALRGLQ